MDITSILTLTIALIGIIIALYQVKINAINSYRLDLIATIRDIISDYIVFVDQAYIRQHNYQSYADTDKDLKFDRYTLYAESSDNADRCAVILQLIINESIDPDKRIESKISEIEVIRLDLAQSEQKRERLKRLSKELAEVGKDILKTELKKVNRIISPKLT